MKAPQVFIVLALVLWVSACAKRSGSGGGIGPSIDHLVASRTGNFVYAPDLFAQQLHSFRVDMKGASQLSHVGSSPAMPTTRLVFSPDGRTAYMGREIDPRHGPDAIVAYGVDSSTGALTEVGSITGPDYCNVGTLDVSPDGRFLAVGIEGGCRGQVLIYALDPDTGVPSSLVWDETSSGQSMILKFRPDGNWLYSLNTVGNSMSVYRFDAATGAIAWVSSLPMSANITEFELHPSGRFAYVGNAGNPGLSVYGLSDEGGFALLETPGLDASDLVTGFADPDLKTADPYVSSIEVSQDGRFVYVSMPCYRAIFVFAADAASGHLAFVQREDNVEDGCYRGVTLTLTSDGKFAIVPTETTVEKTLILYYAIDPGTGMLSPFAEQEWAK